MDINSVKLLFVLLLGHFVLISASPSGSLISIDRDSDKNDTLVFAHVLYRHGDSNIEKVYPNDPYKNESYWPGGYGELTNQGKKRHFALGQYFRRRYGKLIGNEYLSKKVYIQSTDVDRTIMSAQVNLAGLFYPSNDEVWNEEIKWQPVPVHTVPQELDYILFVGKNCPKFNAAVKDYQKKSKEVQRIYTEYAELFTYWTKMCGKEIKTIDDVYKLHKTLEVERDRNLPLPDWAQKAIEPNGTMEYMAKFYHKMYADNPQLARVESGFLLGEILGHFHQKVNSTLQPDRSLWLYSAHSITVSFMLHSLGLFELHIPPFACSIHFELYKNYANEHYLQLFYRKSNEEYPLPLNIPGCGQKCPLDQFQRLYEKIIPTDFDSECLFK